MLCCGSQARALLRAPWANLVSPLPCVGLICPPAPPVLSCFRSIHAGHGPAPEPAPRPSHTAQQHPTTHCPRMSSSLPACSAPRPTGQRTALTRFRLCPPEALHSQTHCPHMGDHPASLRHSTASLREAPTCFLPSLPVCPRTSLPACPAAARGIPQHTRPHACTHTYTHRHLLCLPTCLPACLFCCSLRHPSAPWT